MTDSPVIKHRLANGLTVLLKEVHTAPVVSWWVLYRVGSRNEPTGKTGISHWVEHMLFKGTEQFPAGTLDRMIDRIGGVWNAQTFIDYTAYYETLPAEHIDLALRIEADRMVNAQFDPEDVESERTVIISERQGLENSPTFWLSEEVTAAAFRVHGYHHEVIGDMADLLTITRDDLYEHYRRHYVPSNAIAVAVGDFDHEELLQRITALYGSLPGGPAPDLFVRPEPPQTGERRVVVERPGHTAFIEVAYHVPEAAHDDWFALEVLNSILCGPDGFGGGGIDNKTSRLYKALVETELATYVSGSMTPTIDPFLYSVNLTVRDGRHVEEVEAAYNAEIERLRRGEITEAELQRAKKQARALFAYGTERVTMQAFWLAFSECFESYEWFENYLSRLQAITLEDVQRAASVYLRPQNRVVGWFIPTGDAPENFEEDFDGDF
ncbi:MAG: pitrilysin family protein [Chloroflexota bacterium]|nr:MAG: insulinase family protein [Chloroflexota bacterium]